MPRVSDEPQTRRHLWLFDDDWEWLKSTFGSNIGISKGVRAIIRSYRQNIEARAAQSSSRPAPLTDKEMSNDKSPDLTLPTGGSQPD